MFTTEKNRSSKIIIIFIVLLSFLVIGVGCGKTNTTDEPPTKTDTGTQEENKTPFLLYIEDVFKVQENILITGKIERGTIHLGDTVEIVGAPKKGLLAKVIKITEATDDGMGEAEETNEATSGASVGITFEKNGEIENIKRGQAICTPGSVSAYKKFEAKIEILSKEAENGETLLFLIGTNSVKGTIFFENNKKVAKAGEKDLMVTVALENEVAMEKDQAIVIRKIDEKDKVHNGYTIGDGSITKLIN